MVTTITFFVLPTSVSVIFVGFTGSSAVTVNVSADYIIGMDTANIRNLNRMLKNDPDGKVYKFLSFTGSGRDIADPWYTGDFEATYRDVVEGCNGFLAYLRREGKI